MTDVTRTDERAARLRQARSMRKFATAKAAAKFFGFNYNTYSQHERGQAGITRAAGDYARAFRVSEAWLLTGEGSPEDLPPDATDELREMFARVAGAPPEVQQRVLSFCRYTFAEYEKARETATNPAS